MMRGTVYVIIDGRPTQRYVDVFRVDNALEFQQQAERTVRAAGVMPAEATFEFGPIGAPWGIAWRTTSKPPIN